MASKIRDYLLEKQAIKGWKQEEMAAAFKVPKGTLSRWLSGRSEPEIDSLQKIADGLGVTLQEVVDARAGKYKPLTEAQLDAIRISKQYSAEAIRLANEAIKHLEAYPEDKLDAALDVVRAKKDS